MCRIFTCWPRYLTQTQKPAFISAEHVQRAFSVKAAKAQTFIPSALMAAIKKNIR